MKNSHTYEATHLGFLAESIPSSFLPGQIPLKHNYGLLWNNHCDRASEFHTAGENPQLLRAAAQRA